MPPDAMNQPSQPRDRDRERVEKERNTPQASGGSSSSQQRIGNYLLDGEIGRGSFATVYKGYKSKSRTPIAIKAVSRQKLTAKLLENLESEINILKSIHHRNIVALLDCFKNDASIYLVMEFCSGSDLSIYIKNRGKISSLEYLPRGSRSGEKVFWPHPETGGLDERVTRHFLGQLTIAIRFLRGQNLIHRDIKPQNLLMQPATSAEVADGHPLGIPVLKVADFGFARILPASAMAETLCGSPLYMAPEILRYEKYDARADLWSVGAVLFEMVAGRPPFRANNHVELLRKIEKGEDRIKFPDESSRTVNKDGVEQPSPVPVSPDLKSLIRALLKRQPVNRMGFDHFFACGVWDGWMTDEAEVEGDSTISYDVSSSSGMDDSSKLRELVQSDEKSKDRIRPTRAPQPLTADPAMNPQPAPRPTTQRQPSYQRSQPKYYVSDANLTDNRVTTTPSVTAGPARALPRPISSTERRMSNRERDGSSVEDPQPVTPSTGPGPATLTARYKTTEGSPLAATPPIMPAYARTGKDESALAGSDSMVGREYVVVEKGQVEVNKLADELEQASRAPMTMTRRQSTRPSVVTRPVSSFKPGPNTSPTTTNNQALVPLSYSPPFALSTTPPFAIPESFRRSSTSLTRQPSIPHMNAFPPQGHGYSHETYHRYSTSPSSYQAGTALARALTNTAIRLIGTSAHSAATALVRATAKRRPTILRTTEVDKDEDDLLRQVEDLARKAFVLFELADNRLVQWQHLGTAAGSHPYASGGTPPFASSRRKSSSSSANSELMVLRQQEAAAGEAVHLYIKAMAFMTVGTQSIKSFVDNSRGYSDDCLSLHDISPSPELVQITNWLRQRFNECLEKIEWAKERCADELPFIERIIHDKAREYSRHAALVELEGGLATAETGYENALWLLQAMLDDHFYDDTKLKDDDRVGIEKLIVPIKFRLEALRKKMETATSASATSPM